MTHTYEWPRPSVTVDLVVFSPQPDGLYVLLVKRGKDPFAGRWALPGGFLNENEDIGDAALRELQEETGYKTNAYPKLFGVYGAPGRDPRGWTVTIAHYITIASLATVQGADDAIEAQWFKYGELDMNSLAFDHKEILEDARECLRRR